MSIEPHGSCSCFPALHIIHRPHLDCGENSSNVHIGGGANIFLRTVSVIENAISVFTTKFAVMMQVRIYGRPEMADKLNFAAQVAPRLQAWLAEETGIPYALPKMGERVSIRASHTCYFRSAINCTIRKILWFIFY